MSANHPVNLKSRFWFTSLLRRLSSPSSCALCDQNLNPEDTFLFCSYCISALPQTQLACFQCGLELPAHSSTGIQRCGGCLSSKPLQHRCISPLRYEFPIPDLVSRIKFHQGFHEVKALCEHFSEYCLEQHTSTNDVLPEMILPVPLHSSRAFTRGFNQAYLLSYYIGKHLGIPVHEYYLKRHKSTSTQRSLNIKMRKQNVKQAFALARPLPAHIKHLAIFDDVITTGATMESVARVLKNEGVERIDFWSLARTPKFH